MNTFLFLNFPAPSTFHVHPLNVGSPLGKVVEVLAANGRVLVVVAVGERVVLAPVGHIVITLTFVVVTVTVVVWSV